MKRNLSIILLTIIFLLSFSCKGKTSFELLRIDFYDYFDTDSYVIIEYNKKEDKAQNVYKTIKKEIEPLFVSLDYMLAGSKASKSGEVKEVNNNIYNGAICTSELYELIKYSKNLNEVLPQFDISIGALTLLWNSENTPTSAEVESAQEKSGFKHLEFNDSEYKITSDVDGLLLDLGAIAKGYVCEVLASKLEDLGYTFFVINIGGNIAVKGTSKFYESKDKDLEIALASPFDDTTLLNIIPDDALTYISTSSDYYRSKEIDGNVCSHIINPKTGYPVESDFASVTIMASDAKLCDALSTACFIMEEDEAIASLEENNICAILVKNDGSILKIGQINTNN